MIYTHKTTNCPFVFYFGGKIINNLLNLRVGYKTSQIHPIQKKELRQNPADNDPNPQEVGVLPFTLFTQ